MDQDAAGDIYPCSGRLREQVRRGWLEKEEGYFRDWVVKFLDVVEVVSTDGVDLDRERVGASWVRGKPHLLTCLKN